VFIHKWNSGHGRVSDPEIRIFAQGQGNQGIMRRCTSGTPHLSACEHAKAGKWSRRLTQGLRKKTHLWMGTGLYPVTHHDQRSPRLVTPMIILPPFIFILGVTRTTWSVMNVKRGPLCELWRFWRK